MIEIEKPTIECIYSDTDKNIVVRIGKGEKAELELKAGMLYILDGELN